MTNTTPNNRTALEAELEALLSGSPYRGYAYAYPHKTAYRRLKPARRLGDLWANEPKDAVFLYLHVPFCEMRCGFCNLFTSVGASDALAERYLEQLARQAERVHTAIGPAGIAQMAFGGGTPTWLSVRQLERAFDIVASSFAARPVEVSCSVETSPKTATPERLALLAERGVSRISMGVQSFLDAELRSVGRPQRTTDVVTALEGISSSSFPVRNIDLIYGIAGQSVQSLLQSIERTLEFSPEEIYLYPLYVRPLTGLGRRENSWDDARLAQYRAGRDRLLEHGYEQVSMRMFRRPLAEQSGRRTPYHQCQEDPMIGLGCGARSYTQNLHYSDDWAISAGEVRQITVDWIERDPQEFEFAVHGVELDEHERRLRHVIKSVFHHEGLDLALYREQYADDPRVHCPQLELMEARELLRSDAGRLRPSALCFERADALAPWLFSSQMQRRMEGYTLR